MLYGIELDSTGPIPPPLQTAANLIVAHGLRPAQMRDLVSEWMQNKPRSEVNPEQFLKYLQKKFNGSAPTPRTSANETSFRDDPNDPMPFGGVGV